MIATLGIGLIAAILRLAWIGDDAYITLRTVENLVAGHGPVWNVGERVQTYTHPAWFWLLAAARWLTGEHYFTTITLSVGLTAIGVVMMAAMARSARVIILLLLLLLGSRAFGDYATSGLETPLVTLLLVCLGWIDHRTPAGERRLLPVAFIVGMCGLTRLDLLVLVAPVLLAHMRKDRFLSQAGLALLAMTPLIGWSLFAAWYYGSPFPITAYAKAFAPNIPTSELLVQGLHYFQYAITHDPLTLLTIVGGALAGLAVRDLRGRMMALGMILGCIYVARVGGDFMAGRFFVPSFVVACVLLMRWLPTARPIATWVLAPVVIVMTFLPGWPPWLQSPAKDLPVQMEHGIQDERRFYYSELGLFSPKRQIPVAGRFSRALAKQGHRGKIVLGSGTAGGIPFIAGEQFHFIDMWLCDPLLMRLPVIDPNNWRIGHFTRGLPEGYPQSIAFGENRLTHTGLKEFYDSLRTVTRAEPNDPDRWEALMALLLGTQRHGLRDYAENRYRQPQRLTMPLDKVAKPTPVGAFWFDDPELHCVERGGMRLEAVERQTAKSLVVHAAPLARYRFVFRDGEQEVGRTELLALIDPGLPPTGDDGDILGYLKRLVGLHRFEVPMPEQSISFDSIDIEAEHPPWIQPAIGSVLLGK